jgi:hypothetical protein
VLTVIAAFDGGRGSFDYSLGIIVTPIMEHIACKVGCALDCMTCDLEFVTCALECVTCDLNA